MVHEIAAAGFSDPSDYEAARPSYPPDAVQWFVEHLHIGAGARVVDLAAGTGKLTRLLTPTGANIVGVEPVAGMRTTFRSLLPHTPLLAATAEALAFADASLDAITAAQAWHWFDHERAIAEAARALKPGGGLGVVWNARDRSVPWVDEVWSIMDRVEKHAPWRDHERDRETAFDHAPGFDPPVRRQFRHTHTLPPQAVVQRVASVSHVAVLPPAEREAVLGEVLAVLTRHAETSGRDTVGLPYRVDCLVLLRT